MITIGIRAAPREIAYAIYDENAGKIVNVDELKVPLAFETPDALKYIRSNILDIMREYEVKKAGIRVFEAIADNKSIPRVQIEGVIQEAFASSSVEAYYIGRASSISKRIGSSVDEFKSMVKGEKNYPMDDWSELSSNKREAVLCAVGAVNA